METAQRHAIEKRDKLLEQVQDAEWRHEIARRWTSESSEWKDAAVLAANHRYQKALDKLEGLVVSRLFELTKMNMSRTGKSAKSLTEPCLMFF